MPSNEKENDYCISNCHSKDRDKDCCKEQCLALTAILQSIAAQEKALSAIICAEADKIKKAICICDNPDKLIEVNESVRETIEIINDLEKTLKEKALFTIEALQDLRCHK